MSGKCYEPADFERLLDLPAGHEDLQHLQDCVACQTEFDLFRSFLSTEPVPAGADLAAANAKLTAFLADEVVGDTTVIPGPGSAHRPKWDTRRWTPVLVAASLVCVAIFVNLGGRDQIDVPSGVVRDLSVASPDVSIRAEATPSGFHLSWQGPPTADEYQVVIMDPALDELERVVVTGSRQLQLDTAEHPWLAGAGPILWRVEAKLAGDEIARSAVRVLEPNP